MLMLVARPRMVKNTRLLIVFALCAPVGSWAARAPPVIHRAVQVARAPSIVFSTSARSRCHASAAQRSASDDTTRDVNELPPAAAIWKTALPLFAACLCEPFLTLIDTAAVGNLGTDTAAGLAALASNGAVFDVLANVFASLCTAATNVVASASVRGPDALRHAVYLSLYVSLVTGLLGGAAVLCGSRFLVESVFSISSPTVASRALSYMRLRGAFVPIVCVNYALYGVLLARADTSIAVRAVGVSACVNVALDGLLVGALGLSTLGAAVATVASQASVCAILLRHVERTLPPASPEARAKGRTLRLPAATEVLPFGGVFGAVGFGTAVTAFVHAVAARVVAASGSVASAAGYQVSFQAVSLLSCVAVPLNLGVQSLLAAARAARSGARVRALVRAVIGQSAIVGVGVGASAAFLLRFCARLLTADAAVVLRVRPVVPLCAATACAWCMTSSMYGVFVALGLLRSFVGVALLGAAGGLGVLLKGGALLADPLKRAWLGALVYSAVRLCVYTPILFRAISSYPQPGESSQGQEPQAREESTTK